VGIEGVHPLLEYLCFRTPHIMRSRCFYLSGTKLLFCAKIFVNLLLQHIHAMKCLLLIFHNLFTIIPIDLHFSLQASHSHRLMPSFSSIRLCLNITHADMYTFVLLFLVVRPFCFLHISISHIGTKLCFLVPLILQECVCNKYC
jgi:hypothetical protein